MPSRSSVVAGTWHATGHLPVFLTQLTLVVLTASLLSAQPTAYEVRATVVDDTGQPISDVQVHAWARGKEPFDSQLVTNSFGVVTFSLPRADRYIFDVGPKPGFDTIVGQQTLELTDESPTADIRLEILRLASLSGTVVDAETREPVEGAIARIVSFTPVGPGFPSPVTTDPQGRFNHDIQLAWLVTLRIEPQLWENANHYQTEFTPEDAEQTDEDYAPVYPLGGDSRDTAVPLVKTSSLTIQVPLRRITYQRVAVRFDAATCEENETFQLSLLRDGEDFVDLYVGDVPCGQDVLLLGMLPGSRYHLELSSPPSTGLESRRRAQADFTVPDRNLEIPLAPTRGLDLLGRVVLTDGSASWPADMKIIVSAGGSGRSTSSSPDEEGRFLAPNVLIGEQRVSLRPLGDTHVIQRIQLNGADIAVSEWPRFDWQGSGELVITLDDRPGSLTGVVRNAGRAAPEASVKIVPWPLPDETGSRFRDAVSARMRANEIVTSAAVDAEGRYSVQRLPAGEYRVFAIPWQQWDALFLPGSLEGLAARGEKVTIDRGAHLTLDLRLTDPTR